MTLNQTSADGGVPHAIREVIFTHNGWNDQMIKDRGLPKMNPGDKRFWSNQHAGYWEVVINIIGRAYNEVKHADIAEHYSGKNAHRAGYETFVMRCKEFIKARDRDGDRIDEKDIDAIIAMFLEIGKDYDQASMPQYDRQCDFYCMRQGWDFAVELSEALIDHLKGKKKKAGK